MNETLLVFCYGSLPSKVVQITTYSLLMASSLIGNILVVGVFYRNNTLRTAVHYFIMNMAVSDLIYPVVYLPFCIARTYLDGVWLIQGTIGTVLCKITWNAGNLSNIVSQFSMVLIGVDRFHGVVFPMKPPLFSNTKCRFIIVCVWLSAVVFYFPFFYLFERVPQDLHDNKLFQCVLDPSRFTSHEMTLHKAILIFAFCITFGSALLVTVLYSSVLVRLYRQKRQLNLSTEQIRRRTLKNRRITWMLLTVVILFYLVWIPPFSVNYIFLFKGNVSELPCIYIWLAREATVPLYPVLNPVVYYIYNDKYRQGFKDLLSFCYPCRAVTVRNRRRANNADHMNHPIELEQQ